MKKKTAMKKSLRIQLFLGLLVPIVLLAIYGVNSYQRSEEAIITGYERSATDTVNALSDYINLGLKVVESKAAGMSVDQEITDYFEATYEEARGSFTGTENIRNQVNLNVSSDEFIEAIHLIGANGANISSIGDINDELYRPITDSTIGKTFKEKKLIGLWFGLHDEMDKLLKEGEVTYDADDYAASFIRKMNGSRGYIVVDISRESILERFNTYSVGEGSLLALVLDNDRELIQGGSGTESVVSEAFYQEAIMSEEPSGFSYQFFNNSEHLFIYSQLKDIDAMVCMLIPKSMLLEEVQGIRVVSIAFVSISLIIAIIIMLIIGGRISGSINGLQRSIVKASEGDLTTTFQTKRKDEFYVLSSGISTMMENMRGLLGEVHRVNDNVNMSASELSGTSGILLDATKEMSSTIEGISKGIVQQAEDAEMCLIQMSSLSEQMNLIQKNTAEIEEIASTTKNVSDEGKSIIDALGDKASATSAITQDVIKKIHDYELQVVKIESFVNIINDIAEQTNLLSLNASIEAARAGKAGSGFAVVADEIRKLADQSVGAANQIKETVALISNQNKETVASAEAAEEMMASQTEALTDTIEVFDNISGHIHNLASNVKDMSSRLDTVEAAKNDTLGAISNISAVTEETAAASEEMNATAANQMNSVEELREAAITLNKYADELKKAMDVFTV